MKGREIVRAFAAGALLFLASDALKPAEAEHRVNVLERPCDVPGGTVADYGRNIIRAAEVAHARNEMSIGESLMGCPPEAITHAVREELTNAFRPPRDGKTLARLEVVDILLQSRNEVMTRRAQAAGGAI